MKTVNKYQLLYALQNRVNNHLQEAIETLQNMHSATLLKPAANGGWSIAQCLEHLNRYGDYYLPAIQQELAKQNSRNTGTTFTSTWLGRYFTRMMEPKTGTKKIKAFKAYIPPVELDAHAAVANFIQQQETLLQLLQLCEKADLNKIKIPVSIAKFIRLRLGDVLQFIIAHNERHLQQAKRNYAQAALKALPFS